MKQKKLYGLVMCGGKSSRMGTDKSRLNYHGLEQRYWMYNMLQQVCTKVWLGVHQQQFSELNLHYPVIVDSETFANTGPLGGLLSAFAAWPEHDFLVFGCDYPGLTFKDVTAFLNKMPHECKAAAFYNKTEEVYEPLLAFYSYQCYADLLQLHSQKQYALQKFLKQQQAFKFTDFDPAQIISIDTPEEQQAYLQKIQK